MTEESSLVLRADKCAGIILSICELFGTSIQEATDMFYSSETANLIEEGVADLHCRSNKYLATLVWDEHTDKANRSGVA